MKKLLLAVALVGGLASSGRAAAAITLSLEADVDTVDVGGEFTLSLIASGLGDGLAPSIAAFDLDVSFDALRLVLLDVDFGTALGNPPDEVLTDALDDGGVADVAALSLLDGATLDALQGATVELVVLHFQALAAGIVDFAILLDGSAEVDDAGGFPLPIDATTGTSIEVVPEPTSLAMLITSLGGLAISRGCRRHRTRP